MSLSSVSVRRPVFATVLSLVIIIFGVIGFRYLGVREYPQAERPIVSVATSYPGASAEVIENQITEILEEEINTVSGIRTLTSVSREGRSTISVEFDLDDDLDRAANDVRDRVSAAMQRLPEDADAPVVEKADSEGDPIVFLNIKSDQRNLLELTEIADNLFKSRFETIEGVGRVDIWGDKEYAMRLWMLSDRLAAYGLSPVDVLRALQAANAELPSGRLEGENVELSVRTASRLGDDPEVFNDLVIVRQAERVVRFRDIGHAEIGPLNERTILKRDGVPMVGVVLRPQSGANEIAIVDEFYRRLEQIRRDLPADIELGIGFDTSEYIRASIREVQQTLLIALGLVCLTVFLFLRELRSAIIPIITIPVSLTGACFVMYLAGFSLNILTLLGLVLAIGLVVDDAVIVVENIYAKIEKGMEAKEASVEGIREIFLAVIATTLSLVAVFAPIVFLGGLTGVLFSEFGITLAGAVVTSSFVALTLTPMLCSRILKRHEKFPWFYSKTEPIFESLRNGYRARVGVFIRHPWLAAPFMLVCLGLMALFWVILPRELAPLEDRGLLVLSVEGPQGANYDYMREVMDEMDAVVSEAVPEREALISVTSPGFGASTTVNSGFSRLVLTDAETRDRSQNEIAQSLGRALARIPGAEISVRQPATINTGGRGLPVSFVVQNPDFERLKDVVPEFLAQARQQPEFSFVNVDLKFDRTELNIEIDRNRASALGVSVRDIAQTIQSALSGQRYGYFLKDNQQYEIIGQLDRPNRDEILDLRRLTVRDVDGRLQMIDNLTRFTETSSPPVLYRYNRFPAATFSANLAGDTSLGEGIQAMQRVADELLDETFSTELSGQSREFADAGRSLVFVFGLALLLVYLVLSAQFESFRAPLIIMLTVPLALAGALLALWYFGQTLNIFSQIGLIMLVGLISKNGILLVEFAIQRQQAGLDVADAIEEAAVARLRPILMTAISTILGVLPIALALGAGSESRVPLGICVIGGMVIGTFLTLFVIPAAFRILARRDVTR